MPIILAGVSHHNTPLEMRERFFFPENGMSDSLERMSRFRSVSERVILSTCNRVELYACAESIDEGVDSIYAFLMESRGLRRHELADHLYIHSDEEATRHLFLVASSLDSMVVGEPQILGQVKEAYRVAQEAGHTGKTLTGLFSRAFRVAKKVRDQTKLGKKAVSVSSVAVELAGKIFGSLNEKTVLLLGAGEMAELAARHLVSHGAKTILVANRTHSSGETLAKDLGGRAVIYGDMGSNLARADIVISSTGAPHTVVKADMVSAALEVRRDAPIFLIDIAVPRDIEPAVHELENAYLYDIDDLQAVVSSNVKGREEEALEAISIVEREVDAYLRRSQMADLSRTFSAIRVEAEAQRQGEVSKTLARFPDLGEKERQAVEAMSRAIVNKLLHRPFDVLRKMAEDEAGDDPLPIVQRMFGVELDGEGGDPEKGDRN
ncbi:MAG TPA: glutamyl-tRNA reductase [Nitrospinae bacterium]|nr:glutamyl-tRNA reductase [Nitrospinota bacterium]